MALSQDRVRVAGKATHEIQTVQEAMKREGITVSAAEIRQAIEVHGHGRTNLYAVLRLQHAARGLFYSSEGDYPFGVVSFNSIAGALDGLGMHNAYTVEVDLFFSEKPELAGLKAVLQKELKGLTVYRAGEVEIDALIMGKLSRGGFVGVKTKIIET